VNCTSVGLWPDVDASPLPDEALRSASLVFDTIYRPAETRLLRIARSRQINVLGGADLFLQQAGAQHQAWHMRPAPLEAMRRSLGDALRDA
jgi:shikimate 5-dehydrogenase